jgi:hypothetical protein
MGAWDVGPFDNDHAADFASYVHACTDIEARWDLLAITLGAFMGKESHDPELHMDNDSENPSIIEEVIASAAFVADGASGRHDFTQTPYAMEPPTSGPGDGTKPHGWTPPDEPWVHADLGNVPTTLIHAALMAISRVTRMMRRDSVDPEWIDAPDKISDVLAQEAARR